jgi:hypothetical protein
MRNGSSPPKRAHTAEPNARLWSRSDELAQRQSLVIVYS